MGSSIRNNKEATSGQNCSFSAVLYTTNLISSRDVEKLLNVAAGQGVQEAQNLLDNIRNRQLP